MKQILILNGHPDPASFNHALSLAYQEGAEASGAKVTLLQIGSLQFNPNLQYGYRQRMELEPDLQYSWKLIQEADHLVWIHPVWWGGLPAVTKGFIDRLFLPGMAFRYRDNSVWWDKLLKGKTAHIITTMDQPSWYYRLVYARPSINQLRKTVLQFCGIKPVKVTYIGIIKQSAEQRRSEWLKKVRHMGSRQQ